MTHKELLTLRGEKEAAMANIVETRSENMDSETLDVLKTFKAEIHEIDNKIEAIDELRSVALKAAQPAEVKALDKQAELSKEFRSLLVGDISGKEYEKRAATLAVHSDDIVPDEFLKQLDEKILEYGALYGQTSKLSTQDNGQVLLPRIDDTANAGAWTDEGGAYSTADFATSNITMDAFKLTTGIQVSEELLQDSFFNVESYVANAFATRLARTIEGAIVAGDGVKKPLGIIADPVTKTYDSAVLGVIDTTDLLTAIYELQPSSRNGAIIYVSDDLMKDLTLEVDGDGRPLLQTSAGATPADPVKTSIGGYPVQVNYELQAVATGVCSAIIGNPKGYTVRNVQGFSVKRDEYSNMSTGMVNFYASMRLDGKITSVNDTFVAVSAL